jgi:glutamyl-tRNA synthetase
MPIVKERIHTLAELPGMLRFLFEDVTPDEKAAAMLAGDHVATLRAALSALEPLPDWTADAIHQVLGGLKESLGLSSKQAFQPVRAAVTGTLVSPPLYESMELLGRERSLSRIRAAVDAAG